MKYKKFHRAILLMLVLKHNEVDNLSQLFNYMMKFGKILDAKGIISKFTLIWRLKFNYHAPMFFFWEVRDDLEMLRDMHLVDGYKLTDKGLKKLEEIKKNSVSTDNGRRNRVWERIWADLEQEAKIK